MLTSLRDGLKALQTPFATCTRSLRTLQQRIRTGQQVRNADVCTVLELIILVFILGRYQVCPSGAVGVESLWKRRLVSDVQTIYSHHVTRDSVGFYALAPLPRPPGLEAYCQDTLINLEVCRIYRRYSLSHFLLARTIQICRIFLRVLSKLVNQIAQPISF